jgi:hypothetical protein
VNAVLIALVLVGAVAAPAEHALVGKRAVVVGPVGGDDAVNVVGAALRARGVVVLDGDERAGLDDDLPVDVSGDRERARSHLMAARAAWRQLDFATATSESSAAVDEVLLLPRPEDHLDVLFDATIFLAALRLNDDVNDPQAQRALQLAARLEPTRETLDPALHPPSRVAAFAAARAAVLAADDVVVVATPRLLGGTTGAQNGIELVVDGDVQTANGGLLHLQRGPHLLTVRGPSGAARSRILDVADGSTIDDVVVDTANLQLRQRLVATLRTGDTSVMPALLAACGVEALITVDVTGGPHALRRGRAVVAVPAQVDPAMFANAVVATLDDVPDVVVKTPAGLPPLAVASVVGGSIVVGAGLIGFTVWRLLPGKDPDPVVRPVVVGCCVQ